MNDQTPINEGDAPVRRERRLPAPLEAVTFALQERVIWPLQDRFTDLGPGGGRGALLGGGAAAVVVAGVAAALALSGGGSSPATTTTVEASGPRPPLAAAAPAVPEPKPQPSSKPPGGTLHGAPPDFSPPSPAGKQGKKTVRSKSAHRGAHRGGAGDSATSGGSSGAGAEATGGGADASTTSPAGARISSDPGRSAAAGGAKPAGGATAARAELPDGPPAGPAALKVAREFAQGFVAYETGGQRSEFEPAFEATATPRLAKALLRQPPRQPAQVKVPQAKVLNVVAGPSQGGVYEVSVSLLRVGVTSELRLDMEKLKNAGWRVTNVLG